MGSFRDFSCTDSVFSGNVATEVGGAIDVMPIESASLYVTNTTFDSNSAGLWGGALAVSFGGDALGEIQLRGCKIFSYNKSF